MPICFVHFQPLQDHIKIVTNWTDDLIARYGLYWVSRAISTPILRWRWVAHPGSVLHASSTSKRACCIVGPVTPIAVCKKMLILELSVSSNNLPSIVSVPWKFFSEVAWWHVLDEQEWQWKLFYFDILFLLVGFTLHRIVLIFQYAILCQRKSHAWWLEIVGLCFSFRRYFAIWVV